MTLYYNLPVFKDVYKLILLIFEYTNDFLKEYKYTLGQDLKRDGINLVRSIYRANKAKNKVEYLETFLDDFEVLKIEMAVSSSKYLLFCVGHNQFQVAGAVHQQQLRMVGHLLR